MNVLNRRIGKLEALNGGNPEIILLCHAMKRGLHGELVREITVDQAIQQHIQQNPHTADCRFKVITFAWVSTEAASHEKP